MVATSLEGGAVGGAITTTHYDEKRLSVVAQENIRRGSVGAVTIKGITGGVNYDQAYTERRASMVEANTSQK